jgi:hypothetical protein
MAGKGAARSRPIYGVHPSVAMVQKRLAELRENTGRSMQEWMALIKEEGPGDEKGRREWLKSKQKMGTMGAAWLAERASGKGGDFDDPESYLRNAVRYVEEQYAGPKDKLRPIYEELLEFGRSIGADVKVCPCRTIVPLYRAHVFAQIKPTTNTRVDLGLALAKYKGKLPKRLVDTGGLAKKDRITHRIELKTAAEIDGDVKKWLKTAYDLDG